MVSVTVIVLTSFAAAAQSLTGIELTIFRSINNWPESLRLLFFAITQLGSAWVLYAITLTALWKRRYRLSLRLFFTGAVAFIMCELLKQSIGRPRPEAILGSINLRDSIVVGNGFPSGHTAVATALAFVLWPLLPSRWRWLAPVLVMLVGLSRVYLGVHAPLDIVGGIAVGVLVVSASKLITGKLRFVTKITGMKLRA